MSIPTYRIDRPEVLANPYALYAALRKEGPVGFFEPAKFFAVGRYDDVTAVLKNNKTFSNHAYRFIGDQQQAATGLEPLPPSLVAHDPPRHTQLRNLILRAFTPSVIASLEPRIREISRSLVAEIAKKDTFDLVSDFSIPLPMIVIAELLGVEPERREEFKRWCDDMLTTVSFVTQQDPMRSAKASIEVSEYFKGVIEKRGPNAPNDLLGTLLKAEIDGEKLSLPDVLAFANLLLLAGNETTTSLLGNALAALTDHPDQYQKMLAEPKRIPNVIEEVLRWQSPAQMILRVTTEDTQVGGVALPKGAVVTPMLASANRDEARFPNGEQFDIERDTRGHIAFGLDIHFCLGASLSRLEGRVALEELSALGPLKRVDDQIPWAPSLLLRSPMKLELTRA